MTHDYKMKFFIKALMTANTHQPVPGLVLCYDLQAGNANNGDGSVCPKMHRFAFPLFGRPRHSPACCSESCRRAQH